MKKIVFLVIIIAAVFLICNQSFGFWQNDSKKQALAEDTQKAEQLVKTLHVTEVLGPLAPVALSPFFGLTCLSATSIMVNNGVLPENEFLMGNDALNNVLVLAVFSALTILTSVPKLTTASKAVAELGDQAETYAGIISYAAIFMLADFGSQANPEQVVYTAGIFSFAKEMILMLAIISNIIVINTVKFFFELLVLISPVPLLDAMFEAANKAFAAFLALIYAFNPYLAFALNIILFLICLSIFNFCRRRMKYLKAILLEPLFYGLRKKLSGTENPDPDKKVKLRLSQIAGKIDLSVKVFPRKKNGKIKKKELCYFVPTESEFKIIRLRLIRAPKIEIISKAAVVGNVEKGLLSNTIRLTNSESGKVYVFSFSKVYNDKIEKIISAVK